MKRNLIAILIFSLHQVVFSNQLEFVGVGAAGDKFSKNKGGRGLTATKLIKIINEEML